MNVRVVISGFEKETEREKQRNEWATFWMRCFLILSKLHINDNRPTSSNATSYRSASEWNIVSERCFYRGINDCNIEIYYFWFNIMYLTARRLVNHMQARNVETRKLMRIRVSYTVYQRIRVWNSSCLMDDNSKIFVQSFLPPVPTPTLNRCEWTTTDDEWRMVMAATNSLGYILRSILTRSRLLSTRHQMKCDAKLN